MRAEFNLSAESCGATTTTCSNSKQISGNVLATKTVAKSEANKRKLVNDNVPLTSARVSNANLAPTDYHCQQIFDVHLKEFVHNKNHLKQNVTRQQSTIPITNNKLLLLHKQLTSTTYQLDFKFISTKIALIYIAFSSLLALNQRHHLLLANQHHQNIIATATNFYRPQSISVNHQFGYEQGRRSDFLADRDNVQLQHLSQNVARTSANVGAHRRTISSTVAAAAAATAAALATANAALARRGQSRNLMIGQNFNNFTSAIPYSMMMQDVDYTLSQEDPTINEPPQPAPLTGQLIFQNNHRQSMDRIITSNDAHRDQIGIEQQFQHQADIGQLKIGNNISYDNNNINQFLDQQSSDGVSFQSDANQREPAVLLTKSTRRVQAPKSSSSDRALLPLDSNRLILPQMQQIKARFNQGCVGGTKCQFFAFCWMSGGSLGASCGLLMTCCVTPSRQEIQPGFYGPVINDPHCGRSTNKINRIVGGTDASFGQFPWQAFVQVGGSRCGGALISSRHVVTAGHCVARSQHSPSSIKVTLGDYILNSDIESIPHEVFSVVEVLLHPNFRFTPQADRYDVAVLELDRTASYKDNIKPICLPQKDATFVGRVAYVAGWGALQAGSKLRPKVLQHVAVPVTENHVCESWHRRKGIDIRIYDEMMCAGYELGQRDACQGDSGGPLMLNQFGVWYLVGIVSAGYSCAKQYQPGIYHRKHLSESER